MKLAEALALRGDTQKKLTSLRERIALHALVQEGVKPAEEPSELLLEAFGVLDQLRMLVTKINIANSVHCLPDGRTLTIAMATRDELIQRHSLIKHTISSCHKEPDRYSVNEIRWVTSLDVKKLQKQADDLAKQIRELNLAIQQANWQYDLE
jgi:hypothetical protein